MAWLNPPVNENDHFYGIHDALITIVQYGDFQCAQCVLIQPVISKLRKTFGNSIRYVFRHFPLPALHEYAFHAALTAEAAARQHKFWDMHDLIYAHQHQLSEFALLEFASELRMDMSRYKMDMHDPSLAEKIDMHYQSGLRSGVTETPAFFINGIRHNGYFEYPDLYTAITEHIHQLHHP